MDNMFSTPERKLTFPEEKVKESFGNTNIGEVKEEDEEYSSVAESDTDMKVESFSDDNSEKSKHRLVVNIFQFCIFSSWILYSYNKNNNNSNVSTKSDNSDDSLSDQSSDNGDDESENAGSLDGSRSGDESIDDRGSGEESADENKAKENESDGESEGASDDEPNYTSKKGTTPKKNISSDEESNGFYNNDAEEVAKQKEKFATLNENALDLLVTKGISDGERLYFVVSLGDTVWYNAVKPIKLNLEMMYEKKKTKVPFYVEHLGEHKLRVEHSATNKMEYPPAKKYPKSRWFTVIATSTINPQEELMSQLKKFSTHFKKLHSTTLVPSPGQRWMNYTLNSGNTRVIEVCKNYMGDDDNVVIDRINRELIDLGNKPHKYSCDETLDKFLPDYYTKQFLQDFLNATSWDSISEKVKKLCYKGYPNRQLPDWNKISI